MKKPLTPKTTAIVAGLAVIVLAIAGLVYFKPQIGAGPVVPVVPYAPPGSAGYGPGGSKGGGMGAASPEAAAASAPEGSRESEAGPGTIP